MIKTRTGAQRYNTRMNRLFDKAMRLKKEADSSDVIIEIRGGVAEILKQPSNINILIKDYDNESVGE